MPLKDRIEQGDTPVKKLSLKERKALAKGFTSLPADEYGTDTITPKPFITKKILQNQLKDAGIPSSVWRELRKAALIDKVEECMGNPSVCIPPKRDTIQSLKSDLKEVGLRPKDFSNMKKHELLELRNKYKPPLQPRPTPEDAPVSTKILAQTIPRRGMNPTFRAPSFGREPVKLIGGNLL
jgi:hypothetical protein